MRHERVSSDSPLTSDDDTAILHYRRPLEVLEEHNNFTQARALGAACLCMVAIGHCQYTWTLFVTSLQRTLNTDAAAIQLAFSFFVALQTTSVLALGLILPSARHERSAMACGGLVLLVALHGLAGASSLSRLYASAALMGIGVGMSYNVCMAVSVRTFTTHRGLAAGVVAAGYGAGTLPTIAVIEASIETSGASLTYRALAWALSATILTAAAILPPTPPPPPRAAHPKPGGAPPRPQLRLVQVLREPSFYLLYAMLILISAVGLVVTAQLKPMARALGVTEADLVLALEVDRVLNGVSRPVWGLVSDIIGRENTLALAFGAQALVLAAWSTVLSSSTAFVAFSALSTFAWGEIYSLFPALAADLYGTEHVGQNYGAIYTGKAVASFLAGPLASSVAEAYSWVGVIRVMAVASAIDAALALALKRLLQVQTYRSVTATTQSTSLVL